MCPACKKPMIALELEGIEIDHCLDCGGTWLDSGEIGVVCNPNPNDIFRPQVKVVTQTSGAGTVFHLVDLDEKAPDNTYYRSIVKSVDPSEHGIKVAQAI